MNRSYETFCSGMRGLTNTQALVEIIKKLEALGKKRRENYRATMLEELLKQLLDKTRDSERNEIFAIQEDTLEEVEVYSKHEPLAQHVRGILELNDFIINEPSDS